MGRIRRSRLECRRNFKTEFHLPSVVFVAGVAGGSLAVGPDGSVSDTPDLAFSGIDGSTCQVSGGSPTRGVTDVTITAIRAIVPPPPPIPDPDSEDEEDGGDGLFAAIPTQVEIEDESQSTLDTVGQFSGFAPGVEIGGSSADLS